MAVSDGLTAFSFSASVPDALAAVILAVSADSGDKPVHSAVNQVVDAASRVPVVSPTVVPPDAEAEPAAELIAPESAAPEVIAPELIAPEAAAPDVIAPDVIAPDVIALDVIAPDVIAPDAAALAAEVVAVEAVDLDPHAAVISSITAAPAAIRAVFFVKTKHALY